MKKYERKPLQNMEESRFRIWKKVGSEYGRKPVQNMEESRFRIWKKAGSEYGRKPVQNNPIIIIISEIQMPESQR